MSLESLEKALNRSKQVDWVIGITAVLVSVTGIAIGAASHFDSSSLPLILGFLALIYLGTLFIITFMSPSEAKFDVWDYMGRMKFLRDEVMAVEGVHINKEFVSVDGKWFKRGKKGIINRKTIFEPHIDDESLKKFRRAMSLDAIRFMYVLAIAEGRKDLADAVWEKYQPDTYNRQINRT